MRVLEFWEWVELPYGLPLEGAKAWMLVVGWEDEPPLWVWVEQAVIVLEAVERREVLPERGYV